MLYSPPFLEEFNGLVWHSSPTAQLRSELKSVSASKIGVLSAIRHCLDLLTKEQVFVVWLYGDVIGTMLLHQEDVWTEHDSFLGVGEVERDVARAVLTSLLRNEEIIFILGKPFVLSCLLSIQHKHCLS